MHQLDKNFYQNLSLKLMIGAFLLLEKLFTEKMKKKNIYYSKYFGRGEVLCVLPLTTTLHGTYHTLFTHCRVRAIVRL